MNISDEDLGSIWLLAHNVDHTTYMYDDFKRNVREILKENYKIPKHIQEEVQLRCEINVKLIKDNNDLREKLETPYALWRGKLQDLHTENKKLRKSLKEAVRIYGKYNMLVNEPGRAGKWIESAQEALK